MERGLLDTSLSCFAKWWRTQPKRRADAVFPLTTATLAIINSMDKGFVELGIIYPSMEHLTQAAVFSATEGFAQTIDAATLQVTVCWQNVPDETVGGPLLTYWRFLHHIRHELGIKTFLHVNTPIDQDYYMVKMFVFHAIFFGDGNEGTYVVRGFTPLSELMFQAARHKLMTEEHALECVASATPGEMTVRF